jgi:hypothetical protein
MLYAPEMSKETDYSDVATISPFLTSFFELPPKIPSKVSTKPGLKRGDHALWRGGTWTSYAGHGSDLGGFRM